MLHSIQVRILFLSVFFQKTERLKYTVIILHFLCGLDSTDSGLGLMARSCKHGNRPLGSIKSGLTDCKLLKKDFVA